MKAILWILGIVVVLASIGQYGQSQRAIPLTERYPAPWVDDYHLPISQALTAKGVRDCGQYKYRQSSQGSGEYLVRCTRDGKHWRSYLVWPSIGTVIGPNNPAPELD